MKVANKQTEKRYKSRLPRETIARAKEMRDKGIVYLEIARVLGIPYSTLYYALNSEARARAHIRGAKWYRDNVERHRKCGKRWRKDHPERDRKWRKDHPECIKKWRKDNPEKCNAYNARRRALKRGATIGDPDEITEIYRRSEKEPNIQCYICGELSQIGDRAVDHIFPISKGYPTAPFNLAIVHIGCNSEKYNKMPEEVEIYDRSVVEKARQDYNKLWLL